MTIIKNKQNFTMIFFSSILIFLSLLFFNMEVKAESNIVTTSETPPITYFIEAPENATEKEKQELIERQTEYGPQTRAKQVTPVATFSVVRSGKSQKCELYFKGVGTMSFNTLYIAKVSVGNTSMLKPKTFKTFNKVMRSFSAGSTRYIKLGELNIPTNEKKVIVAPSGVEVNTLSKGWIKLYSKSGAVTIN